MMKHYLRAVWRQARAFWRALNELGLRDDPALSAAQNEEDRAAW